METWGAFQKRVVEAGRRASCSGLKVPQDGSISECFRPTQGLPLRALGCLGTWSGVQPPSCSGGLRVPAWAAQSSARDGREEGQGRRARAPWWAFSCFNKISAEPKCLLASGHFGCWLVCLSLSEKLKAYLARCCAGVKELCSTWENTFPPPHPSSKPQFMCSGGFFSARPGILASFWIPTPPPPDPPENSPPSQFFN